MSLFFFSFRWLIPVEKFSKDVSLKAPSTLLWKILLCLTEKSILHFFLALKRLVTIWYVISQFGVQKENERLEANLLKKADYEALRLMLAS